MLVTVAELAAYLGITPSGVRDVIHRHHIPAQGQRWKAKLYHANDVLRHTGQRDRIAEQKALEADRRRALLETKWILRFWERVDISSENQCWVWMGAKNNEGYGRWVHKGRRLLAHRTAWELDRGEPIPSGQVIDHLCANPPCVNPHHLDAVTYRENYLRGRRRRQAVRGVA